MSTTSRITSDDELNRRNGEGALLSICASHPRRISPPTTLPCLFDSALGGLSDQRLAKAIGAIHEPERRWKLADLAAVAGMSRTSFAERFRARVGQSPVDYLYRWRMQLAASRLRRSSDTVAGIAFSLGYESEAAFNTAFRRAWGCSPGRYRREAERG